MRHFLTAGRIILSTIALPAAIDTRFLATNAAGADAPATGAATSVVNMSTKGMVGTGSNAMVAGFVIGPGTGETILIRAVGPSGRRAIQYPRDSARSRPHAFQQQRHCFGHQ
jgi:hypothetical protein